MSCSLNMSFVELIIRNVQMGYIESRIRGNISF